MNDLNLMLLGATAMAMLVAALFFLRFWISTRDQFFLLFAISFALEAVNQVCLGLSGAMSQDRPVHYLVRLISYCLIIFAVLQKNLGRRGQRN